MTSKSGTAEVHLRVRIPAPTKKWLAHAAVDHGLSQQSMALKLIEDAMKADKTRKTASK